MVNLYTPSLVWQCLYMHCSQVGVSYATIYKNGHQHFSHKSTYNGQNTEVKNEFTIYKPSSVCQTATPYWTKFHLKVILHPVFRKVSTYGKKDEWMTHWCRFNSQFPVGVENFVSFYLQSTQSIAGQSSIIKGWVILVTPWRPKWKWIPHRLA